MSHGHSTSVEPASLPALPADVMGCIARATFAAEKNTAAARCRLSLVSRSWRESLRGAPLHVELWEQLDAKQLRTALSSHRFGSVNLHSSLTKVQPVPPEKAAAVVLGLVKSAPTLTALHGLPLVEASGYPAMILVRFTQLRSLTLRQTSDALRELQLSHLPLSLEELTLTEALPEEVAIRTSLPLLVDLDSLVNLRRINFGDYWSWELASCDPETGEQRPLHAPPSLKVVRLEQELAHFNLLSIRTTGQHIQSDDASQSDDESQIDGNPHPAAQPPLVANGLTLEVSTSWPTRIGVSVRYAPDGRMLAQQGQCTDIPDGFSVFRLETNNLICSAKVLLPPTAADAQQAWKGDAVQLLCRALRLAPACYCRFELAPSSFMGDAMAEIEGEVQLISGSQRSWHIPSTAFFEDFAEFAAAMQRVAVGEGLSVQLSQNQRSIIVRRISNELPGGAAAVQ